MGNNLIIRNSNYWTINTLTFAFIRETRAHVRSIEFARQLGIESAAYLFALGAFEQYLSHSGILNPKTLDINPVVNNLSNFDQMCIKYQIGQIESLLPTILEIRKTLGIVR